MEPELPGSFVAPTVGRIVHYQSYGTPGGEHKSAPRAAVVTATHADGVVDLAVLNPEGMFFNRGVRFTRSTSSESPGGEPTPGCWNWPPRA